MGFLEMYGMGFWSNVGRQNLLYNVLVVYNSMMQSMMNMGNSLGVSNMMVNRYGRR